MDLAKRGQQIWVLLQAKKEDIYSSKDRKGERSHKDISTNRFDRNPTASLSLAFGGLRLRSRRARRIRQMMRTGHASCVIDSFFE